MATFNGGLRVKAGAQTGEVRAKARKAENIANEDSMSESEPGFGQGTWQRDKQRTRLWLTTSTTMAVGSSSRYKSKARRQASSDIEEDQPTQGKNKDRADDDEDAHSRRSRTVKREKKPTASRRAKDDDSGENVAGGGENDEDNDDGRINIDDFHNQPLVKADGGKLQGLASDWDLMEKKIRQNWNVVGDVAAAMAEVAEGKEGEKVRYIR